MGYDMNVAAIAYTTAINLDASDKVLLALFEAGIVESGMRNLNYGDKDSVGFLQQRPSMGWGTVEQCTNVEYATTSFVKAAKKIESKYQIAGDLAAAVQKPAKIYEYRYNESKSKALNLLKQVSNNSFQITIKLPVEGATEKNISSQFGEDRIDHIHKGIDIAMPLGTTVFTLFGGTVTNTGYSSSYGNFVELLNPSGYSEFFAHLSKISVEKGYSLLPSNKIGEVGSTGYSTGNHLHYEIRTASGEKIDPIEYLKNNTSTSSQSSESGILSSLQNAFTNFVAGVIGTSSTMIVYIGITILIFISLYYIFGKQKQITSTAKNIGKEAVDIGVSFIPGGNTVSKVAKKGLKSIKGGK